MRTKTLQPHLALSPSIWRYVKGSQRPYYWTINKGWRVTEVNTICKRAQLTGPTRQFIQKHLLGSCRSTNWIHAARIFLCGCYISIWPTLSPIVFTLEQAPKNGVVTTFPGKLRSCAKSCNSAGKQISSMRTRFTTNITFSVESTSLCPDN